MSPSENPQMASNKTTLYTMKYANTLFFIVLALLIYQHVSDL